MEAMLNCDAMWGVEGKAGKQMSFCMEFIEFLGENSLKLWNFCWWKACYILVKISLLKLYYKFSCSALELCES